MTMTIDFAKVPDNKKRPVGKDELRVNVLDYGVVGNNSVDDTEAFVSARDEALALHRTLWIPAGLSGVLLTAPVDCSDLDCQFDSKINVAHDTGPGVTFGGALPGGVNPDVSYKVITSSVSSTPTNPTVRFVDFHGAANAGTCTYMQLWADASVTPAATVADAMFYLRGSLITKLEISGVNGGWINENKLFGGRIVNLVVSGDYPHNCNKFVGPDMQGSTINFLTGNHNVLEKIRAEGGITVSFATGTYSNEITVAWSPDMQGGLDTKVTLTDNGQDNIVSTVLGTRLRPLELFRIDRHTKCFDAAYEYPVASTLGTPVPGIQHLKTRSGAVLFDSGPVEIGQTAASTNLAEPAEFTWRTTRFLFVASHVVARPRVYCYDANGILLDPTINPGIDMPPGWAINGQFINSSSPVAEARIVVSNPNVQFIRVALIVPTVGSVFDWMSLIGYAEPLQSDMVQSAWKRTVTRPLFQTTIPTQGLAQPGESIGNATGRYTCVARVDTTLTAVAATGATTISVAAITGISSGDLIGVLLSDGTTHWTTVSGAPSGSTITLAAGLSGAASSGAQVSTNRWVTV